MAKASSANLGSWPVAVSVAVEHERRAAGSPRRRRRCGRAPAGTAPGRAWRRGPRNIVNIEPEILIARSLSRMPSCRRRLPVRHPLVLGELGGQVERTADDGVVGVATRRRARRGGQVRDAEQELAQRGRRRSSCSSAEAPARRRRARGSRPGLASAAATSPARRSWPTSFDSSLTRARVSSRWAVISRSRSSSSAARGRAASSSAGSPRRASRRRARPRGRCAAGGRRSRVGDATGRSASRAACGSPARGDAGELALRPASYVSWSSSWPTISAVGIVWPRR